MEPSEGSLGGSGCDFGFSGGDADARPLTAVNPGADPPKLPESGSRCSSGVVFEALVAISDSYVGLNTTGGA